jgi:hypothetical protein
VRLGLSRRDLVNIACVCHAIEIHECTPDYLQDFIVARLKPEWPVLAQKVRRLNDRQMDALCQHIKDAQASKA